VVLNDEENWVLTQHLQDFWAKARIVCSIFATVLKQRCNRKISKLETADNFEVQFVKY